MHVSVHAQILGHADLVLAIAANRETVHGVGVGLLGLVSGVIRIILRGSVVRLVSVERTCDRIMME